MRRGTGYVGNIVTNRSGGEESVVGLNVVFCIGVYIHIIYTFVVCVPVLGHSRGEV